MKIYSFFDQIENHKEYAARKIELNSLPTIENIEVTSLCNLKCKMCIRLPIRSQKMISLDQIMEITLKNIDLLRGEYVWLHHFGEPLMHPQLIDIIKYLSGEGINPRLSTNATLLNYEISKELITSGLKEIVFSIDGVDKEPYESLRVGADFNQVMENTKEFLKIKKFFGSEEPVTQVQFVNLYGSEAKAKQFAEYWSQTEVNWINIKSPSTRAMQISDKKIKNGIMQMNLKESPQEQHFPCYWLWSSLIILSDGNVVPCCTDLMGKLLLGNVFNETLMDIWNGETARLIRKEQIKGKYQLSPICGNCPEIRGYVRSFEEKQREEYAKLNLENEGRIKFNHHLLIKNG